LPEGKVSRRRAAAPEICASASEVGDVLATRKASIARPQGARIPGRIRATENAARRSLFAAKTRCTLLAEALEVCELLGPGRRGAMRRRVRDEP
jgi:hypothetical protein